MPLAEARAPTRSRLDWSRVRAAAPRFTGVTRVRRLSARRAGRLHRLDAVLPDLGAARAAIPTILDDPGRRGGAQPVRDAQELLAGSSAERLLRARGVFGFWPAQRRWATTSRSTPTRRAANELRALHFLRQQMRKPPGRPQPGLADFVAPRDSGRRRTTSGAFAVTRGHRPRRARRRVRGRPRRLHAILAKALADRLAEAFAERLHRARARASCGATPRGRALRQRRPHRRELPRHPARARLSGLPRPHGEARPSSRLLDAERSTGITLTETFAMLPAASVSGFYFCPPECALFRGRQDRPRPGRGYGAPQGNAGGRGRALAGAEPRLDRRTADNIYNWPRGIR